MAHTDKCIRTHSFITMNRYDPTHTTTIRNDFAREMRKRFDKLRGVIRKAVIDDDCFGLMQKSEGITALAEMSSPGRGAFAFNQSSDKVEAFMEWLQEQYKKGILEVYDHEQLGRPMEEAWTNKYVRRAYVKGISTAHSKMIQAGYKNVLPIEKMGGIDAVMNAPFHVDRVGLMYTRTFNELKGITSAMGQQLSRILAQSMAEGKGPIEMARILNKTIAGPVGGLGITDTLGRFIPARRRAETLARTEVIRAHHQATVQEYRNWGAAGVIVKAEWTTAGDARVCEKCAGFEGKEYTLDEIEGMIPAHPNCRCIALPVDVTDKEGEEVRASLAEEPSEEQTEKMPEDKWARQEMVHDKYYKYKADDSWVDEAMQGVDTDNWEVEKVVIEVPGGYPPKPRKYVGIKFTNKNFESPGKGFQTFYHETSRTNTPSIAEKGLLEDYGNRRWGPGGTWANKSKHLMGNDDVTIEIKAPKGFFEKDPDGRGWIAYEDIPPKWIKSYTMFRDADLDYKNLKIIPKPIPEEVLDFFRLPPSLRKVAKEGIKEVDTSKLAWTKYNAYNEVVDALEEKLNIYNPSYIGKSTDKTMEKVMIERMKLIGERLSDAADKHPGLARMIREMEYGRGVRSITFTKGKYTTGGAKGEYLMKNKAIEVALSYKTTGQKLNKIGRKSTWTVGDDFLSSFMHEYGHHIHLSVLDGMTRLKWTGIWKEYGSEWFKANVSKYAGADAREAFAESFCAYMSPDYGVGGNRMPQIIEDFMREVFD